MYTSLVRLTIDSHLAPAAARVFSDRILPAVTALEGFVAGYWTDPEDDQGFGFILFEAKEQAEQVQPGSFDWSAPGVQVTGVDVRRVALSVP